MERKQNHLNEILKEINDNEKEMELVNDALNSYQHVLK